MEGKKLNVYLDEIGRTSLLSQEQEQKLSTLIKAGDTRALNRLVEANLRLVVAVANQYQGRGLTMDDLIGEGNIGLMKAASKYDSDRGTRFAGYAVPYVRRQIEKALKRESGEQRVETQKGGQTRSVDAPLGTNRNVSLLSVLVDANSRMADERVYNSSVEQAVEYALRCLNERETEVVTHYFGLEQDYHTLQEIALDMGLKRERVRQIRDRAIRRLRKVFKNKLAELRG